MRVHLYKLIGYNPATPGPGYPTTTLYFGTHGYTDHATGTFYEPVLKKPGLIKQSMFAPGTTGGESTADSGVLQLTNNKGQLDYLANWAIAGYTGVLLEGEMSDPLSSFAVVMTVTQQQPEFDFDLITLRFKDRTVLLDTPVRLSTYAGTNVGADGLEGSLDLKDKEKPRLLGTRYNFQPVCVNTARQIYQFNDGLSAGIIGVRDSGVELTEGNAKTLAQISAAGPTAVFTVTAPSTVFDTIAAHGGSTRDRVFIYSGDTLPAPLINGQFWYLRYITPYSFSLHPTADDATANLNAITATDGGSGTHYIEMAVTAPGSFDYCFDAAGSYFRLGSLPIGTITMGAWTAGSLGQAIKSLALEKVPTVVEQSIIDLDNFIYTYEVVGPGVETIAMKDMPWGLYTGQSGWTTKTVLDKLTAGGIWWSFDNLGNLWAKQLSAQGANPLLELTKTQILSLKRVTVKDADRGVSPNRTLIRYQTNDARQTSLAASVYRNPVVAAYYESTGCMTGYGDGTVSAYQPLASEPVIDSVIQNEVSARAIAQQDFTHRYGRTDRLQIKARRTAFRYPDIGVWDDESITELPASATVVCSAVIGNYVYVVVQEATAQKAYRLNLSAADSSAWEPLTDPPTLMNGLYCSLVTDGANLYLIGAQKIYTFNTAAVSNPWVNSGVTLTPTDAFVACCYGGCIYLIGGYNGAAQSGKGYKIIISGWTVSDAGLTDYANGSAPIVYGSGILIGPTWYVGGGRNGGTTPGSLFYSLNLTAPTGAWVALTALPRATQGQAFTLSLDATHILMIAGTAAYPTRSPLVDSYNLTTGLWSVDTAPLPQPRIYLGAVTHNSGVYVIGGYIGKSTVKLCTNALVADRAKLTSIGRTLKITVNRYGYNAGIPLKIIGVTSDCENNNVIVDVWGPIS